MTNCTKPHTNTSLIKQLRNGVWSVFALISSPRKPTWKFQYRLKNCHKVSNVMFLFNNKIFVLFAYFILFYRWLKQMSLQICTWKECTAVICFICYALSPTWRYLLLKVWLINILQWYLMLFLNSSSCKLWLQSLTIWWFCSINIMWVKKTTHEFPKRFS